MMSSNQKWRNNYSLKPLVLVSFVFTLFYVTEIRSAEILTRTTRQINSKSHKQIKFFLYPNSQNINYTEELHLEEPDSILKSNFSVHQTVKILIHGFHSDCNDLPNPFSSLKQYLLLKAETNASFNLICVDWAPLSRFNGAINAIPLYVLGRITYSQLVGQKVAKFLTFLVNMKMIKTLSDVHLIGQSMGAQIAGIAGLKTFEITGGKVGRISGLDPAGPLYRDWPDLDEQLDRSDAEFVDIFHTAMKRAGLEGKYGHADFYINGGFKQPSCSHSEREGRSNHIIDTLSESVFGGCSHSIVGNYWADSIRAKRLACKADTYDLFLRKIKASDIETSCKEDQVVLGENCPTSARGKYFVNLNTIYTPNPSEGVLR